MKDKEPVIGRSIAILVIIFTLCYLLGYLYRTPAPSEDHRAQGPMAQSDQTPGWLKQQYLLYNDQYFWGALDKRTFIVYDDSIGADGLYAHILCQNAVGPGTGCTITVNPKFSPMMEQKLLTLQHEMCHQWDYTMQINEGLDGHNDNFQNCMVTLAKKGAMKGLW